MTTYRKVWANKPLSIPTWATPRSWLNRSEAASVLGVPRSTLHRLAVRVEGPPYDAQTFAGNAVRYRLVHLLAWWGTITGKLPSDAHGIWEWWLADEGCNLKERRKEPPQRGSRPRSMRSRRWRQLGRKKTRTELLWAEVAIAAINAEHPVAKRELMAMARELQNAPARTDFS